VLDHRIFGQLSARASRLRSSGLTADANDRILYDAPTGTSCNVDGMRGNAAMASATITRGLELTANSGHSGAARLRSMAMDPTASRFRNDIQGLRAIAVLSVVLYHASIPFIPGGYVGVDIFFVISGFLITSHLLASSGREGGIKFGDFYARRARRILPASFVVLVLSIVAALVWLPPLQLRAAMQDAIATALYVPNYLFAAQGTNYLSEYTPSIFQHYWSLGVEEQFYLVWPALIVVGLLILKSRKRLSWLIALVVFVSFIVCVLVDYRAPPWAFFSLPTRAWELGVGGLTAFVLVNRGALLRPVVAAIIGWVGLIGALVSIFTFSSTTFFPGYAAALPTVSVALVILGGATPSRAGPTAVLSLRPLVFIGLISYSLYLVHWPALVIPQAAVGYFQTLPLYVTVLIAAVCVPVAWLLYRFVETPMRNTRGLVAARPRRSLVLAAVASVATVCIALAGTTVADARPLSSSRASGQTTISDPPDYTPFVPSNLEPTLAAAADDNPIIFSDGCQLSFTPTDPIGCTFGTAGKPAIALFGDSHAGQWFPALYEFATKNGYRVEAHTKSSCPSAEVPTVRAGAPYTACDTWRAGVIAQLKKSPPAIIILANYGANIATDKTDVGAEWAAGLTKTMDDFADTAPVAVIADTPDLKQTPSICLSAHLTSTIDCSRSRSFALASPTRDAERAAVQKAGAYEIDLTNFLCSSTTCAPIVGRTLIYRDAQHLTATFSRHLGAVLGEKLEPLLISSGAAAQATG
jgi:peptidoglycan/LPS O-acetylase OafA/YrhL